jgi:hypothetical protein
MNRESVIFSFVFLGLLSISYVNAQSGYISPYISSFGDSKIAKEVANLISVLSAGVSLLYALQIYQKMQKGEEEIANKIYIWLMGFILLFIGSMFVSWFFFQDYEAVKVY